MAKRKCTQSPWAIAVIALLVLLALFLLFKPVLHAPTDEAKMEKNVQNGKVQQTQTVKIDILAPQNPQ